ncbi:hypothetical protein [Streptomyces jumonjinensis]|uniref:hypothetical protein n=1 Tax=Streptomyces jumonjinensis TaxID=1945 RepID=UPI0037986A73
MSTAILAGIARTDEPKTMLRRFLALDAVVTLLNGLVYLVASEEVGRLIGVDDDFLLGLGIFLALFGVAVGALAGRRQPAALAVKTVIDLNLLYGIVSIASVVLWFDASTAGAVWIPLQGLVVAAFALLQISALRARDAR